MSCLDFRQLSITGSKELACRHQLALACLCFLFAPFLLFPTPLPPILQPKAMIGHLLVLHANQTHFTSQSDSAPPPSLATTNALR